MKEIEKITNKKLKKVIKKPTDLKFNTLIKLKKKPFQRRYLYIKVKNTEIKNIKEKTNI